MKFLILSVLFSFIQIDAFVLPWERQTERKTPWGGSRSAKKKEARENFFERLSFMGSESTASLTKKRPKQKESHSQEKEDELAEVDHGEDPAALNELPWASYRSAYKDSAFPATLKWPVKRGKLISGYGYRMGRAHEGLDIKGSRGEIIRAAAAGKVAFNGVMGGYGRILVLAHGNGYATVYAHNMANLARYGEIVEAGQPIAHVGMSGNAKGYHVHFEIRKKGQPINPLQYQFEGSPMLAQGYKR